MSKEDTLAEFLATLSSINVFKGKIFSAGSQAELSSAQAGLARLTNELNKKFPEFNKDLISEFHKAYRESGGVGPVPKNFYQKAYNSRQKAAKGYERATVGLRQWGTEYGNDRAIINARKAYTAKIARLEKSGADKGEIAFWRGELDKVPSGSGVGDEPSIKYRRKSSKGNMHDVWVPADTYMKMATNSAYNIQRNLGVLAAYSQKAEWVIVLDGLGCGKVKHNDGGSVNGQVWQIAEAMKYPLSHPNCHRSFIKTDGPPGSKKLKEQQKILNQAGHDRTKYFNTLKEIAKVAATAGVVGSIAGTVITNPFIQRFMREIVEDSNIVLSPIAQQLLNRLSSYATREASAFEQTGKALGASTQEEFNRLVAQSFDDDLSNRAFLELDSSETVTISQAQARTLGLNTRPTKGQLLERLDDYGDWVVHRDAIAKAMEERLQSAANFSHAADELYSTAALKFHIEPGPGVNAHRNWYNVVHNLKETYARDPDKAERDLIRLTASVLDPTPWLSAKLAPGVKFTMGMTARGRGDLAVRLFDKLSGSRALSAKEAEWAQALGMDLKAFAQPESITARHIVKALQPRITYQPGGLFSATIALQNGKLVPIIRLYPNGTFGRFVSLESKLRAGAIEDFIQVLRDTKDLATKERFVEAFNQVTKEDFITSINLFRNSPLQVSLRMLGVTPDSFAIRALPENDFLRYSYRFTLDFEKRTELQSEIRRRLLAGEDIDEIIEDISRGYRDGTAPIARKEAAKIVKRDMENWMEGFTILPSMRGGFTLNGISIAQKEVLVKMRLLGNNFLIFAKSTRYGYDQILEMWNDTKVLFDDFIKTVSKSDLAKVKTFKQATDLLGDALRKKTSRLDLAEWEDIKAVDLDFASEEARNINPALTDDLARFRIAWEKQFRLGPLPNVEISDTIRAPLEARAGVILIRRDVAEEWEMIGQLRRKAVRIGHFAPDTEANVNNLIHEGAHAIILQMSKSEKAVLLRKMLDTRAWPGIKSIKGIDYDFIRTRFFGNENFRKALARRVSGYGSTDPDELMAEALTEYFGSNNPRAMAKAFGDAFTDMISPVSNIRRVPRYPWENMGLREVNARYSKLLHEHERDLNKAENTLRAEFIRDGQPKEYGQQWWWLDEAPEGLEDWEIDRTVLAHKEFMDDATAGMQDVRTLFPNTKLPRLGFHRSQVGTNLEAVNGANMYYHRANKNIFVTEFNLDNYDRGREMRALGERIGHSPRGTQDSANTVVHEMGHVFMARLNRSQYVQVLEWFKNSGLAGEELQNELNLAFEQTDNFKDVIGDLGNSDIMQHETETMLHDLVVNDIFLGEMLSHYGITALAEVWAEAFLDGVHNMLAGATEAETAKLVKLLQSFDL